MWQWFLTQKGNSETVSSVRNYEDFISLNSVVNIINNMDIFILMLWDYNVLYITNF